VRHVVKLGPVRLRNHDDALGCDRVKVIGYRVVCSCGQRSKVTRNPKLLAVWRDQHLRRAVHS